MYLKAGVVELYENQMEQPVPIPFHTGRWILADEANWRPGSRYSLKMTDKGYEKFVEDSEGFFKQVLVIL